MKNEAENPYAAPQTELPTASSQSRFVVRGLLRTWLIVFFVNLPLPILLGIQLCERSGWFAMLATVVLLLMLSSWLVVAKPWFGRRLIPGGVMIAISQCLPILHLMIAGTGCIAVEAIGLYIPPPPVKGDDLQGLFDLPQYSPPAIMFLTLFVGISLMLVAFAVGSLPIFVDRSEILEEEESHMLRREHEPSPTDGTR